ncbi:FtsQ-type POTRA domain-containing protein [Streptomyces sp. NA04227]|uniref:cell division protein FtsQ/DivIB n=1 Tax=Streptomyces sp. NA04227 TaxID=2742136 RepID=UPI0015914BE6|nr:FtsQ-type POTRA domain-containing protein [Streptomyces sp. NA04227]QKW05992.1 FtsQ-type POTRA domain-containing protein [Streptomyces sp. NA04227]
MAGSTTAERGERQEPRTGPPRPPGPRLTRPRLLLLVLVVLLLLTGFAIWALYGSSWLRAEKSSVRGTRVLTPAQVREAADLPIGSPLISVDTDAVEARLRKKLPRIDLVDVSRSWPHTISVELTERKAVLLVRKDGRYTEVDAEGVRFAELDRAPEGIPVLELATADSPSLRRFPVSRLVREAVRVAGRLPDPVARETRLLKASSYDDFSLELSGGRSVEWGSSEKSAAKARTLTALLKAAPKARHFDVSVPTAPATSRS